MSSLPDGDSFDVSKSALVRIYILSLRKGFDVREERTKAVPKLLLLIAPSMLRSDEQLLQQQKMHCADTFNWKPLGGVKITWF